jgi:hypothetical protein
MSMPSSAPELGNGRSRSPRYSGPCRRHQIGQPTSPLSSWCTGRRSYYPPNCSMGPQDLGPSTRRGRRSPEGCHQLTRIIHGHCRHKVCWIPTSTPTVPHTQASSQGFPGRRFSSTTDTNQERKAQVVPALGGILSS